MILIIIRNIKGRNKVNNFLLILDWINPPIVDDKVKLTYLSVALGYFIVFVERLTHDGNEHVQHVDTHDQTR